MQTEITRLNLSGRVLAELLKAVNEKGGAFKFTARGMSMSPFICSGDALIIYPISSQNSLKLGEIAAFIKPGEGRLIIHRVVSIKQDSFIKQSLFLMKGDNIYQADGFYRKEDILGRVGKIIPENSQDKFQTCFRSVFFFIGVFKPCIALLSRCRLLTLICRAANRILYGNPG